MARPKPPKSEREEILQIVQELVKRGEDIPEAALEVLRTDNRISDFRSFIRLVNPDFVLTKHAEVMVDVLERLFAGELQRVMIWLPPRLGKTELVCRLGGAYYLLKNPTREVMLVANSASLAESIALETRTYFESGGGEINPDARAKADWRTSKRGGMFASGVGARNLPGRGADLLLIDDYHSRASDISSEAIRSSQREFWDGVVRRRTNRRPGQLPTRIAMVMQRWSPEDICAYILSKSAGDEANGIPPEHWHIVAFDGIKEDKDFDIPDWCTLEPDWREPGEALSPTQMSLEEMHGDRINRPWFFYSQIQQRPQGIEGQLCCLGDFNIVTPGDEIPTFSLTIRGWDIASSEGKGDYTVGAKIGLTDTNDLWILDIRRDRKAGPKVRQMILDTAISDHDCKIIAAENAGVGKPILQELLLEREMNQFMLVPVTVSGHSGNLRERALPLFGKITARKVYVVQAPWTTDLLNEFVDFGSSKHDDIVSAVNIALTVATQQKYLGTVAEPEPEYPIGSVGYYRKLHGKSPDGLPKRRSPWNTRRR